MAEPRKPFNWPLTKEGKALLREWMAAFRDAEIVAAPGMTQAELARRTGLFPQVISAMLGENPRDYHSSHLVPAVCKVLKKKPYMLLPLDREQMKWLHLLDRVRRYPDALDTATKMLETTARDADAQAAAADEHPSEPRLRHRRHTPAPLKPHG